jgi:hypothetical protein
VAARREVVVNPDRPFIADLDDLPVPMLTCCRCTGT